LSMPHKHKRKRDEGADFNLPPTERARPLPVTTSKGPQNKAAEPKKRRRKGDFKDNDAPREFRRLIAAAHGKRARSGLDEGIDAKKTQNEAAETAPRIRPGEDLRTFAARVDAALPVTGLTKKTATKDGKDEFGFKVQRTRKERKMQKLYEQWRAEDRKIKEKQEDELELAAEDELENDAAGITASVPKSEQGEISGNKKSRRRHKDSDEDPWLELKRRRGEAKRSLHDTAQAPPELHKISSRQLKVDGAIVDAGNVPRAAGSLRRREELQEARNDIVAAYRRMRGRGQEQLTGS